MLEKHCVFYAMFSYHRIFVVLGFLWLLFGWVRYIYLFIYLYIYVCNCNSIECTFLYGMLAMKRNEIVQIKFAKSKS